MKRWILRDDEDLERLRANGMHPIPNPMNGEGWNPDYMELGVPKEQTPTYYKLPLGIGNSNYLVEKPSVELLKEAVPGNLYQIIPGTTIRYGNDEGSRGVSESHGQVTDTTCQISLVDNFMKMSHPQPLPLQPKEFSRLNLVAQYLGE
jgi:hypothetical protein